MKERIPHTLVVVFVLTGIVALFTHIIPAGAYDTIEKMGQQVIIPNSYKTIGENPQGIIDLFSAPIAGVQASANIIFFVLVIGGAFGVLNKIRMIESALGAMVKRVHENSPSLLIIVVFVSFSLGGSTIGMSEETIPFALIFLGIFRMMGYDSMTVVATIVLGAHAGNIAATTDPFSVIIAQKIAGVAPASGIEYRAILWLIFTCVGLAYVLKYAEKVKEDPTKSLVHAEDLKNHGEAKVDLLTIAEFTTKRKMGFLIFVLSIILMVYGMLHYGWYMRETSVIFFIMSVLVGLIYGLTPSVVAKSFVNGAKDLLASALVIGVAKGIVIVANDGNIMDTVLHYFVTSMSDLPRSITLTFIMLSEFILGLFVTSTSGTAALTMPLFAPMADLLEINKNSIVLAYQFGISIASFITPASTVLITILAITKVPLKKWVEFASPFVITTLIMGVIALNLSVNIWS